MSQAQQFEFKMKPKDEAESTALMTDIDTENDMSEKFLEDGGKDRCRLRDTVWDRNLRFIFVQTLLLSLYTTAFWLLSAMRGDRGCAVYSGLIYCSFTLGQSCHASNAKAS